MQQFVKLTALLLLAATMGCVERKLTIDSDPAGAIVALNDHEMGRTPVSRDFVWYGTYDVALHADGYEPLKTKTKVWAPWWQWPPFDLVAQLLPLRLEDHQVLHYTLSPPTTRQADPQTLARRGQKLRNQLESSEFTGKKSAWNHPKSRPAKPHTRPAEHPDL